MAKKAAVAETIAEVAAEPASIVSIKGFDSNLRCRDFQFAVGETYSVSGKIKACENGFHAVDAADPFHVWDFYPIITDDGKLARYAEVVQSGVMDRQDDDNKRGTKIASASITISAELSLPDFIRRAVDAIVTATKGKGDNPSGNSAQIGSSGYSARIGSSGDSARIGSSGYSARIGSSGDYARIGSSGDYARIGSSGYYAQITASGANSVIASAGVNATATGAIGTWISLAEFDANGKCVGFATGCVGQDGLEPDTAYVAKGGKLTPA
jgi:hypothetical protein